MYRAKVTEAIYNDDYSNSHKYYRIYELYDPETEDARVLYNWGRIGATGQFKVDIALDLYEMQRMSSNKMVSKVRKGYEITRTSELEIVPNDILSRAGINTRTETPVERVSEFAQFAADVDVAIRLATGDTDDQVQAVVMARTLDEQLEALRTSVLEAEGRCEVVHLVLASRLGA